MFSLNIKMSAHQLSGLTDYKNIITTEDTDINAVHNEKQLTFRNGIHVLQGGLGRLEGEESSQAHHAVELPDAQHAFLDLKHTQLHLLHLQQYKPAQRRGEWTLTWGSSMPISSTSLTANRA